MPRAAATRPPSKRTRAATTVAKEVGEGSQGLVVPPVPQYPTVIFADFKQREAFVNLLGRTLKPTRCIDVGLLEELKIEVDVRHIYEVLGLEDLYRLRKHSYAFLTLEFMSSFS